MVRMTTGGVLKSYRYNLMNSFIRDNKARETALTQRVFNSYAEAPGAAAKAFRLRKSRMMTSSQLSICQDTYSKYQAGYQCLQSVDELIDTQNPSMNTLKDTTLRMLNDPEGDARTQLSKVLSELSDSVVQTMNQTYGDTFIFAGADGSNVPFTVEEVDGKKQLYYRGVPVDAAVPQLMKETNGNPLKVDADGKYDPTLADTDACYLKAGKFSPMTQEDYNKLYTVPTVHKDANDKPVEWNADMTPRGEGGYYKLTAGGTISIEDYNAADPKPGVDMKYQVGNPIEVNADGSAYGEGGYYLDTTDTAAWKLIPISEYDDAVERAKNAPQLVQNKDGTNLTVNKDGQPVDSPTGDPAQDYFLIIRGDPKDQVLTQAQYTQTCKDAEKLEYLANEKRFVDIGLGFQEDENGKLIESSAFNASLSGLTFLGYGQDEDGDPKNVYSIVQRLTDIADSVPDGTDWSPETYDEFNRLVGKLEKASSNYKTEFTNMAAGTEKLKNNTELLTDNVYDLKQQYAAIEDVDMADAITSFIWAEYCYNAALKVGNSVLSQSLMDYLN